MVKVVRDVAALRAALGGVEAGLVPTMGALHDGHLALIRRAAAENERAVVSVFVNPTQFGDPLDLARYPRDLDRDVALAESAGASLVYAPPVEVVYPPGFAVSVDVAELTEPWEGASRPGHFRGVATVVSILLNSVQPARAYFGEKDFQQLVVIRRLHRDLVLPGAIVGCPTVRDEDGLALSSRNVRLSAEARQTAVAIPRAMFAMRDAVGRGVRSVERLLTIGRRALTVPGLELDYLAVVDAETLAAVPKLTPGARAIVAATVGGVRLIDNVEVLSAECWSQGRRSAMT